MAAARPLLVTPGTQVSLAQWRVCLLTRIPPSIAKQLLPFAPALPARLAFTHAHAHAHAHVCAAVWRAGLRRGVCWVRAAACTCWGVQPGVCVQCLLACPASTWRTGAAGPDSMQFLSDSLGADCTPAGVAPRVRAVLVSLPCLQSASIPCFPALLRVLTVCV